MKAFMRALLGALLAPLIYLVIQLTVSSAYGAMYALVFMAKNLNNPALLESLASAVSNDAAQLSQVSLILAGVVTLLMLFFIMRRRVPNVFGALGFKPISPAVTLLSLLGGLALNFATTLAMSVIPIPQTLIDQYSNLVTSQLISDNVLLSFVALVLIGPFAEEVIFRGWTFNRLRAGMPLWVAFALQTLIFAAIHFNPLQILYVLVCGAVLGLCYIWTRSLLATILMHASYNCAALVLTYLGEGSLLEALLFASPAVLVACLLLLWRAGKHGRTALPLPW